MSEIATIDDKPESLLSAIMQMAKDPSIDVAKLQALLEMQERMEARGAVAQFNRAFSEMEPKLPRIKKNGQVEYKNKQTGALEKSFKFARWEDIDEIIRPIMREHGFSLSFDTKPRPGEGGGLIVTGTLLHVGGHSKEASVPLALDVSGGKNNIQGAGSTFSYGKRYCSTMLLNLTTEGADDDGVAAGIVYISPEQKQEVIDLMQETKADTTSFLRFLGIDALDNLETKHFVSALNALNAKKRKMAEGA